MRHALDRRFLTIVLLLGVAGFLGYLLLFTTTFSYTSSASAPHSREDLPGQVPRGPAESPAASQDGPTYHMGGVEVSSALLTVAAVVTLLLLFVAGWLIVRGQRQRARRYFVSMACVASLIGAHLCIYRLNITGMSVLAAISFVLGPLVLGFGVAWARSLQGWRATSGAVALAIVVSAAPASMLFHPWPLHLAYFVSESALDDVADAALAGDTVELPRWAGVFRIVDTAIEGGSVALITDPHQNGRSGLVRVVQGGPRQAYDGPMYNLNWDHALSDGWRYQNED